MARWAAVAGIFSVAAAVGRADTSKLWGVRGEASTAGGRLADFSRAGYGEGARPLPAVAQARAYSGVCLCARASARMGGSACMRVIV